MKQYPIYHAYVDGGCFGNGRLNAKAYGSYCVYGIEGEEPLPGIVKDLPVVLEQRNFDVLRLGAVRSSIRPTNNLAEALSMQMLIV